MKFLSLLPVFAACFTLQGLAQHPLNDLWFGTIRPPLAPPIGEVTDRIFIGDNFQGLTYADQDLFGLGTTPTLFYSVRRDAVSGQSFLSTIATPVAPHVFLPPVVDRFPLGTVIYNELAFAAPDLTYGPVILYDINTDGLGQQFGTINPSGAFTDNQFDVGSGYTALTFSATDVTFGANLFYYLRTDLQGTHFGTIDPHQPGTVTDRWILGLDGFDSMVFTSTDVGYGANLFYFIRHDTTTGQHSFGTIDPLTGVANDRFTIGTPFDNFTELSFTTTDVGYGANLFYYLRNTGTTDIPEAGTFWAMGAAAMAGGLWRLRAMRRAAKDGAGTLKG